MMRYDIYLEKGYPIATGVIEGTCGSLVKDRMERSGMRWSIDGAQAVLAQRAVVKNGDWNDFFTYYIDKERDRLYPTLDHTATVYQKVALNRCPRFPTHSFLFCLCTFAQQGLCAV